jgi:TM2 domain-containing membrane protein YozV
MNAVATEGMVFCRACGKQIHTSAASCPNCGAVQKNVSGGSEKRILPAAILCFFFGWFGAHRFYVGKAGTAVLEFLTCCLFGIGLIWVLIDFIMIVVGSFYDKGGKPLNQWT